LLVGSVEPFAPDFQAMDAAMKDAAIKQDLLRADIGFPSTLLAMQSAGARTSAAIAGEGPLNEERRPRLEYGAPLALFRGENVTAIRENDDRSDPARASGLLLAAYLKRRGQPLSRSEYFDRVAFPHSVHEKAALEALVKEWRRRYPSDPLAADIA